MNSPVILKLVNRGLLTVDENHVYFAKRAGVPAQLIDWPDEEGPGGGRL